LHVPRAADTWLDMRCWGKGVVWANGVNLGRYWSWGPQQALYLPAPFLPAEGGEVKVVVLELEKVPEHLAVQTREAPLWNSTAVQC
jgi:beta-galactosidase